MTKTQHGQKSKRNTCTGCRQSKVKCDRGVPCSRCSRLGLECIEQMRCQGRPVKVNFTSEKRSHATMMQQHSNSYYGCYSPAANYKVPTEEAINKLSSFMTHTAADVIVSRFGRLCADGQLQHNKAHSILRSWGLRSCRSGVDCSYGAIGHMAKIMGADLHGLQRPSLDPALKNQEPVIETVAMGSKALHPALRGLDDGMSPYFFVICKNGNVGVYSNDRFSDLFLSSEEACHELREKKILTDYLWAKCFSPSCMTDLYEAITNLNFGVSDQVGEVTLVLTVRDRANNEYPGLVRVRTVCFKDGEYSSTIMSIIPLPSNTSTPLLALPTGTMHQDSEGGSTDEELISNDGSTSDSSSEGPIPAIRYTRRRQSSLSRSCTINNRPIMLPYVATSQPMLPSPVYGQQPAYLVPSMVMPSAKRPCHRTPPVARAYGYNPTERNAMPAVAYEPQNAPQPENRSVSNSGPILLAQMPVANTPADGPPVMMLPRNSSMENFQRILSSCGSSSSTSSSPSEDEVDLSWSEEFGANEEEDLLILAESLGTTDPDGAWSML